MFNVRNKIARAHLLKQFCTKLEHTRNSLSSEEIKSAKPFESIPGPKCLPIVGAAWKYVPMIGNYKIANPMQHIQLKYDEFGSIVRERVFGNDVIFLYDANDIEKILRYSGKYPERRSHLIVRNYRRESQKHNSEGLLPSNGEEWWRLRTVAQKVMYNMKIIKSFLNITDESVKKFILRTEKVYNNNGTIVTTDFYNDLTRFNMQLLWLTLFGQDLNCLSPNELLPNSQSSKLIDALNEIHNHIIFYDNVDLPLVKHLLPSYHKVIKALELVDELAISQVSKKIDSYGKNTQGEDKPSFLDMFLSTPGVNQEDILPLLIDLIFGGLDTTSITETNVLYHLCKNPEVQEKLFEECYELLPNKEDSITEEKLTKAPYLKACIKESSRVSPISVGIGRKTTDDIVLSGYHIPKGVTVVTVNQISSLSPDNFKNPYTFLPERWLRGHELQENSHPFASIPFGNGTRMCIARRLAEQNMYVTIMRMIRQFKLSWVGEDLKVRSGLLNFPDSPITLKLEVREK